MACTYGSRTIDRVLTELYDAVPHGAIPHGGGLYHGLGRTNLDAQDGRGSACALPRQYDTILLSKVAIEGCSDHNEPSDHNDRMVPIFRRLERRL